MLYLIRLMKPKRLFLNGGFRVNVATTPLLLSRGGNSAVGKKLGEAIYGMRRDAAEHVLEPSEGVNIGVSSRPSIKQLDPYLLYGLITEPSKAAIC